jgi:hypothetical protein
MRLTSCADEPADAIVAWWSGRDPTTPEPLEVSACHRAASRTLSNAAASNCRWQFSCEGIEPPVPQPFI